MSQTEVAIGGRLIDQFVNDQLTKQWLEKKHLVFLTITIVCLFIKNLLQYNGVNFTGDS